MAISNRTEKELFASLIAVSIDFFWHYTITSPMESETYFAIKLPMLFLLFSMFFSKPFTQKRALVYSVAFWFIFSIYYRITEVFYSAGWLSRVPDIHLGATMVTAATPLLSALVWYGIHGGAFLVAAYAVDRVVTR